MSGFDCFIKGFGLIFTSGLRRYVVIPFLINLILFSGMIFYAYSYFDGWMSGLLEYVPGFLMFLVDYLFGLLWLLFFFVIMAFMFYTFTIVANIVAAPFNAILAVQVEKKLKGGQINHYEVSWFKLVPRTIARELGKLMYYLPRLIGLVLLSVTPMLNLIAPVLWVLFGAWMMTVQYADYAADNNGKSFSDLRSSMSGNRSDSLVFGISVYIMMILPVINLLVLPASVAGGTVLWVNRLER